MTGSRCWLCGRQSPPSFSVFCLTWLRSTERAGSTGYSACVCEATISAVTRPLLGCRLHSFHSFHPLSSGRGCGSVTYIHILMYIDSLFSRRRYAHFIFDHVGILSTFYSLLYIIGVLCSCVYIHICVVACIHGGHAADRGGCLLSSSMSLHFTFRSFCETMPLTDSRTLRLCVAVNYLGCPGTSRGSTCLSPVLRLYGCTSTLAF